MRPSLALALHRDELRQLAEERGLVGVRVFGSAARGDDREDSDLDLLVRVDTSAKLFPAMGFIIEAQRRFPDVVIDAITDVTALPEVMDSAIREGFLL
jgi:predicted nucleotidyltransferase